jgi:hypothetical protein
MPPPEIEDHFVGLGVLAGRERAPDQTPGLYAKLGQLGLYGAEGIQVGAQNSEEGLFRRLEVIRTGALRHPDIQRQIKGVTLGAFIAELQGLGESTLGDELDVTFEKVVVNPGRKGNHFINLKLTEASILELSDDLLDFENGLTAAARKRAERRGSQSPEHIGLQDIDFGLAVAVVNFGTSMYDKRQANKRAEGIREELLPMVSGMTATFGGVRYAAARNPNPS